ncbi:hypothetical protein MYCTH_96005 [Thermothelomyces thermophilus ATCC 42464]|uniref:Uncharacterized protein n=1 Tax=Thermothelomyces thermophilus (strain ATCC 42464 / BCRC 31852 / DSM 1799) TaxID=573729 RepID=G2QJU9_THET4|nr:uncharacterized protein MYCTH_96005 [Thermothelomyces thermophilus ATCC 42464]AEO59855.1 hypothetical protein MYCTH_96005 [Thermothelomyces thermophilus ATCC 42464]
MPKFSILIGYLYPYLGLNTNATLITYVLGTLLPASYTCLSASICPIPMPIDFGRSRAYRSSLPVDRAAYLVYNRNDLTLTTITIILKEEDKEEKVVKLSL